MISIITPCYNLKDYIKSTYESIVAQTMEEWEWIIVDDSSTDNTVEIILSFHDPRIKLIQWEFNTGNLSILRNKGVEMSNGNFLAFLDGDDICEPERFNLQLSLFEQHPEVMWCHSNVRILEEETSKILLRQDPLPDREIFAAEEAFALLARKNSVCISSVMMKKKAFIEVGGFDESFNRCEDIDLWLRLCANDFPMGYISTPLLQYRVRKSGLFSSKNLEYLNRNFDVYRKVQSSAPQLYDKYNNVIRNYLSGNHLKIAIQLLVQGSSGFSAHFKKAYGLSPSFKKASWLFLAITVPGLLRKYVNKKS